MTGSFLFPRRIKNRSCDPEKEVLAITFQTGKTQEYCGELELAPDEYYDENIYGNYQLNGHDCTNGNQNIRTRVFKK